MPNARFLAVFAALFFPAAALADLNQTVTLSTPSQTNLALYSGAITTSGGDIQFSSTGITPLNTATIYNIYSSWPLDQFNTISVIVVQGLAQFYSTKPIPTATLKVGDVFGVHTNGNYWAKLIVTANTGNSITLQFTTFGAPASTNGGNPAGPPAITWVRNNSSGIAAGFPNYGIAPSSIFVVAGTGLADAGSPVLQDTTKGLPLTLNGASLAVTVGGVTTHPPIYYTSPTQIAAVLPASTPVGTGTLTISYNGVASNAAAIQVVPAAVGINYYYTNTGVVTDASSYALLNYTNSGTPGENIVIWTTGLGADPADSDSSYTSNPHAVSTPLQIYIGGVQAKILYQGSAGYPGVNQINVTIPATVPNGCWISLAAVASGVLSNIATIPINAGGGPCVDPVNGLSGSQVTPAGSQALRTATLALTQTDRQGTTGAHVISTNASGAFESYTGIYAPTNPLSPGGCLSGTLSPSTISSFTGLDPGTITLTGTGGVAVTLANQLGIKGAFSSTLTAGAIPSAGGTFTFAGAGGADVGSFSSVITFSNPILSWTNPSVAATVDRTQPLTVTWTGGNAGSYVYVSGTSTAGSVTAGFSCLANAGDGAFTVPAYILSALPAGTGAVEIQNDIYVKIPASGLDIGIATGEIGISAISTFK
jgi:uncharacterized protein (TIGR03437 family)